MVNGAMTTNTSGEKEVRQKLVNDGAMDCIVQISEKLFFTTGIPCALFFLSKSRNGENGYRPCKNEILFIDARKKGTMVSRKQKALSDEEIKEFSSVIMPIEKVMGTMKISWGSARLRPLKRCNRMTIN